MNEKAAFLDAIRAEPDDDMPRLAFADWLQEHGNDEHAEFIRLQVNPDPGSRNRERDLFADNALLWLFEWEFPGLDESPVVHYDESVLRCGHGIPHGVIREYEFRRGLPIEVPREEWAGIDDTWRLDHARVYSGSGPTLLIPLNGWEGIPIAPTLPNFKRVGNMWADELAPFEPVMHRPRFRLVAPESPHLLQAKGCLFGPVQVLVPGWRSAHTRLRITDTRMFTDLTLGPRTELLAEASGPLT